MEIDQFAVNATTIGIAVETADASPEEPLEACNGKLQHRVRELNQQIRDTQNATDSARTLLGNAKNTVAVTANEVVRLQVEAAQIEADLRQLQSNPRLAQVSFDADPEQLAATDGERLQQELRQLDLQKRERQAVVEEARNAVAKNKQLFVAKSSEADQFQATLGRLQIEIGRIQDDPRLTQVSLDIDQQQLAETERLNQEHLARFKNEASSAEADAARTKPLVASLRQEVASVKAQLTSLRTQLTNGQKTMTQIEARLLEAKLPADASEQVLFTLISKESRRQAEFLALRDSVFNFELALDAATTAAALTRLQQNIRAKEKAVEAETQTIALHQPWLAYFAEISGFVSSQQDQAVSSFTDEYGPRTSTIQRRLRSVYGFDEIEIHSHESSIVVRVKRHGELLRPVDYFSQSQQQTLLLGLFLTACISQTWSGFSPIFLDDPVTHFDDLNNYAFLDLIVGLLDSDYGKRQFIISTCDEKLFQLARQKFRHLGGRAIFYRFEAISPEGPSVRRVVTTGR